MKTASKVFIIIGMILGAFAIFPLILGLKALKQLNTAKKSRDLTIWGVTTIIFVSILGGIFMLLISDNDLSENKTVEMENTSKYGDLACPVGLSALLSNVILFSATLTPLIGIYGIVMSSIGLKKDIDKTKAKKGLILSIIGLVVGIIALTIFMILYTYFIYIIMSR